MNHEAAFAKLSSLLQSALESNLDESRKMITEALQKVEKLSKDIKALPAKRGRMGGKKVAERGPDYFRKLAAMRKTRAGGRPRKSE
jgi:hypothetical protein